VRTRLGVAEQEVFLVDVDLLLLAELPRGPQHVGRGRGQRSGVLVGVGQGLGGPVAQVVGRRHHVARRGQHRHHRPHVAAGGVVGGRLAFAAGLQRAVLVAEHRQRPGGHRHQHRPGGRGFGALGRAGAVSEPVRPDGVAHQAARQGHGPARGRPGVGAVFADEGAAGQHRVVAGEVAGAGSGVLLLQAGLASKAANSHRKR
jgi:hypothetical protein